MTPLEAVSRCVSRDESRYELTSPMRLAVAGKGYLAGTNGHIALLVACPEADGVERAAPRMDEVFCELLSDAYRPTVEISLARLLEWTGPGEYETCNRCDGEGEVNCCCHCGYEHRSECRDCVKGQQQPRRGFGLVLGVKFNRWLIARVVSHASDARIRIGVFPAPGGKPPKRSEGYGCLVLEGAGWRGTVMSAHRQSGEELPVFELEAPAEVRP